MTWPPQPMSDSAMKAPGGRSCPLELGDEPADLVAVTPAGVGAAVPSAVGIGHGHLVGVRRQPLATRAFALVGADLDERWRVAVVGVLENQNLLGVGVGARQPQGEIVGLGSGADEETHAQGVGEGGAEPERILRQVVVEIAGVGVELGHLALTGGDHVRVAVTDMADVVDQIEVASTIGVEEILALAADDLERL